MHTYFDDPVEVLVLFREDKAIPYAFIWNNRKVKVKDINLVHESRDGRAKLVHFAVSDHANAYKLTFNTDTLKWRLEDVYSDA